MFRFNKDIEYALIALVEMTRLPNGQIVSARELSERYAIPFKLLARILQKLRANGILCVIKGSYGGYYLEMEPREIRLRHIARALQVSERIADCLGEDGNCAQEDCGCTIKPIIRVFQDKWISFLENTTLDEFVQSQMNESIKYTSLDLMEER